MVDQYMLQIDFVALTEFLSNYFILGRSFARQSDGLVDLKAIKHLIRDARQNNLSASLHEVCSVVPVFIVTVMNSGNQIM